MYVDRPCSRMRSSKASRSSIVMAAIRAIRARVTSEATLLFATDRIVRLRDGLRNGYNSPNVRALEA